MLASMSMRLEPRGSHLRRVPGDKAVSSLRPVPFKPQPQIGDLEDPVDDPPTGLHVAGARDERPALGGPGDALRLRFLRHRPDQLLERVVVALPSWGSVHDFPRQIAGDLEGRLLPPADADDVEPAVDFLNGVVAGWDLRPALCEIVAHLWVGDSVVEPGLLELGVAGDFEMLQVRQFRQQRRTKRSAASQVQTLQRRRQRGEARAEIGAGINVRSLEGFDRQARQAFDPTDQEGTDIELAQMSVTPKDAQVERGRRSMVS